LALILQEVGLLRQRLRDKKKINNALPTGATVIIVLLGKNTYFKRKKNRRNVREKGDRKMKDKWRKGVKGGKCTRSK
jgi:hypothetical protein